MTAPATFNARITVNIEVLGESQLHRTIQGRVRAVSDWSPAFRKISEDYKRYEDLQFRNEGAYASNPKWADLKEPYKSRKAKKFPGAPILTATGRLRELMTHPKETIEPLLLELSFGGYVVGTKRKWDLPALHQTGRKDGVMVARKVLNFARRQKTRIMRFIRDLVFGEDRT